MNAEKFHYKTEKKFICQTLRGPMLELAARRGYEDEALFDPSVSFHQGAQFVDNGHELGFNFSARYDTERQAHVYTIAKVDTEALPFADLDPYVQSTILRQLQKPDASCEADTDYYLELIQFLNQPKAVNDENDDDYDRDEDEDNDEQPATSDEFVLVYRRSVETVYEADEQTFDITKQTKITHLLQKDILSTVTLGSHSSEWDFATANEQLPPQHIAALIGADNSLSTLELTELEEIRNCLQHLGLGHY